MYNFVTVQPEKLWKKKSLYLNNDAVFTMKLMPLGSLDATPGKRANNETHWVDIPLINLEEHLNSTYRCSTLT